MHKEESNSDREFKKNENAYVSVGKKYGKIIVNLCD